MTRLSICPDCGASARSHTGTYCQECGHPLVKDERPLPRVRSNERKQFLSDILTGAIEAGYPWWLVEQYQYRDYDRVVNPLSVYAGTKQGDDTQAIVREVDDDEMSYKDERHTVTLDTIAHGLKLYIGDVEARVNEARADLTDCGSDGPAVLRQRQRSLTYAEAHLARLRAADRDNDAGDIDAGEADNILQMALLGEIRYG